MDFYLWLLVMKKLATSAESCKIIYESMDHMEQLKLYGEYASSEHYIKDNSVASIPKKVNTKYEKLVNDIYEEMAARQLFDTSKKGISEIEAEAKSIIMNDLRNYIIIKGEIIVPEGR